MNSNKNVVVAIHQPNFFPWLGYFHKITTSDIFVYLDSVQFQKRNSGNWSNRVKLMQNKVDNWITMPIVHNYHGILSIKDMKISDVFPWKEKLLKTISFNYSRAPYFKMCFPDIRELINFTTDNLADFNINLINSLVEVLKLSTTKFVRSSTITVSGQATELLINLTKAVGGNTYLCGGGAGGYQEDHLFSNAQLDLRYQNFIHPIYPQFNTNEFIPGLSIIDALMNCGYEGTRQLLTVSN